MKETPHADAGSKRTRARASRGSPGDIANSGLELLLRWYALLEVEVALARNSLRSLLLGSLALPVLALAAWLSIVAVLAQAAHALLHSWPGALLAVTFVQLALILLLLRSLRRWWRDLTLPQSRAALIRAMQRLS